MTFDHIVLYILGALITSSWIVTWFGTNLPSHIFKTLRISSEDVFTWDEWSDELLIKFPNLGELLSCPLCLGFWVSLVVATILSQINTSVSYWFIPAGAFSWPLLSYLSYRLCLKRD